jgi:hypothetical protein
MPLTGTKKQEFQVLLESDTGDVRVEYVLASDSEHAAWQALELSDQHYCTLKDVRRCDEW